MIDSFCNFSFEYRNKNQIKVNEDFYTPKEILLKNLAKIIDEVEILEKQFNENNSINFIVQNKIISNYGYQPEIQLGNKELIKNGTILDNKFNYEDYISNYKFKKSLATDNTNNSDIKNKNLDTTDEVEEGTLVGNKSNSGVGMVEITLILGFIVLVLTMFTTIYSATHNTLIEENMKENILILIFINFLCF